MMCFSGPPVLRDIVHTPMARAESAVKHQSTS